MINERELALEILNNIENEKSYVNLELKKTLNKINNDLRREKAFITELVNGTVRNLAQIDFIINLYASVKTEKMKQTIKNILRLSVYQLVFLDKVPISAVCNEAVKLSKKKKFVGLSAFVNAILRKVSLKEWALPERATNLVDFLSIRYSHPKFLIEYWLETYEADFVEALLLANNQVGALSVSVNTNKTSVQELIDILENESVEVAVSKKRGDALSLKNTSNISALASFKDGLFFVQDESSALAILMLDPQKSDKILDICAAPGGKTFLSSCLTESKAQIHARDIFEHKLELMNESIKRLGLENIQTSKQVAQNLILEEKMSFDKVILDAPCSGFGLISKKPDIKWNKSMQDVLDLAKLQRELLKAADFYLKDGGLLLYSTCTISKHENEENLDWFLKNFDYKIEQGKKLELFPHIDNTNGFFAVILRKCTA